MLDVTILPNFRAGWGALSNLPVSSFDVIVFVNDSSLVLGGVREVDVGDPAWSIAADEPVNLL